MSLVSVAGDRPTLRRPIRCRHSKTFLPQWLSVGLVMWPAYCQFHVLIPRAMSVTPVFLRIPTFLVN